MKRVQPKNVTQALYAIVGDQYHDFAKRAKTNQLKDYQIKRIETQLGKKN